MIIGFIVLAAVVLAFLPALISGQRSGDSPSASSSLFPTLVSNSQYLETTYCKETGTPLLDVMDSPGLYGEFELALNLEQMPGLRHMLFNVYLPTSGGRTTEVDVIALAESGIYVFESKNYGGWIFGNETSKNWCQSMRGGDKNFFYNPILQNRGHVQQLAKTLGVPQWRIYSFIVFSDRCELKELDLRGTAPVIQMSRVRAVVAQMAAELPSMAAIKELDAWYAALRPYTHASAEVAAKHAADVAAIR